MEEFRHRAVEMIDIHYYLLTVESFHSFGEVILHYKPSISYLQKSVSQFPDDAHMILELSSLSYGNL